MQLCGFCLACTTPCCSRLLTIAPFTGNDEVASDPESSSSGSDQDDGKSAPTGFFILQHRNAQQNLKELTEQKRKVRLPTFLSSIVVPAFGVPHAFFDRSC